MEKNRLPQSNSVTNKQCPFCWKQTKLFQFKREHGWGYAAMTCTFWTTHWQVYWIYFTISFVAVPVAFLENSVYQAIPKVSGKNNMFFKKDLYILYFWEDPLEQAV